MEENIVKKLLEFGFTVNQAKVYLSILQSGLIRVNKISESTQLHRQDIYKMLPRLEQRGLITKTLGKPLMIEAIPLEIALGNLVSIEKKNAKERISRLEKNLGELMNTLKQQPPLRIGKEKQEEPRCSLIKGTTEIKNRGDAAFEITRDDYIWVSDLELIKLWIPVIREHYQTLSKTRARARLIIETPCKANVVEEILKKIIPNEGDFTVKIAKKHFSNPYEIFDHKELWIGIDTHKMETGLFTVLVTNSNDTIKFYETHFETAWNDPHAITVYPRRRSRAL